MKQTHITHAVRRRISQHKLMHRPLLHDPFSDLTLRKRQTNSVLTIFLILPSTQRSKIKRRKGKRVSIVVVASLSRGVRCRSSSRTGRWGWSPLNNREDLY